MPEDHSTLLDEIQTLLSGPGPDPAGYLAQVEETLTAGYARALALEAERWRLERQIGTVARELAEGEDPDTDDLAALARRISTTDGDLARLRTLLGSLRDRARELRVA